MNKYGLDVREVMGDGRLNSKKREFICSCVFCGKPDHLYVNVNTFAFSCKKCGEEGDAYKLFKKLDKLVLIEETTIVQRDNLKRLRELIEDLIKDETEDLPDKKLPIGFKVFQENHYLNTRCLVINDFIHYQIGYTNLVSKLKNYIIIPVIMDGRIKGYVARYGDKKVPNGKLRYANSPGAEFAKMLGGYDDIIKGKTTTVILVEGFFDKRAVDKRLDLYSSVEIKCCYTFGKKISKEQISLLKRKGVENIILLYDFDAIKEIKKYGLELDKFFNTSITFTTKKDIDECSYQETLSVFSETKKPRDFVINTIGKIKR